MTDYNQTRMNRAAAYESDVDEAYADKLEVDLDVAVEHLGEYESYLQEELLNAVPGEELALLQAILTNDAAEVGHIIVGALRDNMLRDLSSALFQTDYQDDVDDIDAALRGRHV